MSERSADWSVVWLSSDPVPADEYDVRRVAADYRTRGEDLESSRSTLQRLSELSGWTGEAAEEFAKQASERTEDLGKAAEKYLDAAAALETYAGHVATARTDTWDGLQRALHAEEERKRLDHDPLEGVADPSGAQLDARDRQWDRRAEWASARDRAAQDVEAAIETLRDRAEDCADDIRSASESFKDSWWDDFKGWVREHVDAIKLIVDILKWVAVAVAVIGIAIALFFTAPFWLTALLVGVGVGLAVMVLAGDAMLLSVGEATWGDVAWDTAGVVLSVVGGRATLQAARNLPAVLGNARNAVVASEQAVARSNIPQNAKNALNITSSRGAGLKRWAERQVADATRAAATNVDELLRTAPTWTSRLSHLDTELATATEKLRVLAGFNVSAAAGEIRAAQRLIGSGVGANFVALGTTLDEIAGQLGLPAPSDVPKGVVDESLDELGDVRWRLSTIL